MLPKRTKQHISESISYRIFSKAIPDNWIIRDITERDYGIDFYMELVNSKSELTGDLLLVQLKSRDGIKWNKKGEYSLSGIKPSTNNYWYSFPIPVFIFLVDIKYNECYYVSAKHDIRTNFEKFVDSKSFGYTFIKSIGLFDKSKELSIVVFQFVYYLNKYRNQFENEILYFLSNLEKISSFIEDHIERDAQLGIESKDLLLVEAIYNNFKFLCKLLQIDWGIDSLLEIKKRSWETFGPYYELYEYDLTKLNMQLKPKIQLIIKRIQDTFQHESSYWSIMNRTLLRLVKQLKYPLDM